MIGTWGGDRTKSLMSMWILPNSYQIRGLFMSEIFDKTEHNEEICSWRMVSIPPAAFQRLEEYISRCSEAYNFRIFYFMFWSSDLIFASCFDIKGWLSNTQEQLRKQRTVFQRKEGIFCRLSRPAMKSWPQIRSFGSKLVLEVVPNPKHTHSWRLALALQTFCS